MRDIRVKTGRYNQHISNQCLLIEVGHNSNTLDEALAAVEYFAAAVAECGGMAALRGDTAPDTQIETSGTNITVVPEGDLPVLPLVP